MANIDIRLRGHDEGATEVLNKTSAAARKLEQSLQQTSPAAKQAGAGVSGAFNPANLNQTDTKIASIRQRLMSIKSDTGGMRGLFDLGAIGQAGEMLNQAGEHAMQMADHLIEVAHEADRADASLSAMAQKRGEGGRIQELDEWANKLAYDSAQVDDEGIKNAAAGLLGFGLNAKQIMSIMPGMIGQARLYHQNLDEVAMSLGRAFASGNVGQLRRIGVVIDQKTMDDIGKITDETEKQKAIFAAVDQSLKQYALGMTQGMGSAEIASNRAALALDQAQAKIGGGAEYITQRIDTAKSHFISWAASIPHVGALMGNLTVIFGELATGIGGAINFAAQLGRAWIGISDLLPRIIAQFTAKQIATDLDTVATEANTVAAGENAVATAAEGAAASGAAVGMEAEAAAAGTAAVATGGLGAAALSAAAGFGALALGVLGAIAPFIAIAAAAAAAMYAIDKVAHYKEDKALQANIEKGNATDAPLLAQANKQRAAKGLPPETMEEWKSGTGSKAPAVTQAPPSPPVAPPIAVPAIPQPQAAPPPQINVPGANYNVQRTNVPRLDLASLRAADRINEQIEKEQERHDKAMAKLYAAAPQSKNPKTHAAELAKEQEQIEKETQKHNNIMAALQLKANALPQPQPAQAPQINITTPKQFDGMVSGGANEGLQNLLAAFNWQKQRNDFNQRMAVVDDGSGQPRNPFLHNAVAQSVNAFQQPQAYSTINSDGSVSNISGGNSQTLEVTAKTQVSQNSNGDHILKIIVPPVTIPDSFGRAVEALG